MDAQLHLSRLGQVLQFLYNFIWQVTRLNIIYVNSLQYSQCDFATFSLYIHIENIQYSLMDFIIYYGINRFKYKYIYLDEDEDIYNKYVKMIYKNKL